MNLDQGHGQVHSDQWIQTTIESSPELVALESALSLPDTTQYTYFIADVRQTKYALLNDPVDEVPGAVGEDLDAVYRDCLGLGLPTGS